MDRKEFESGAYSENWKDALAEVIEQYALMGTNKTDLLRIVETSRRRRAGDDGVTGIGAGLHADNDGLLPEV